MLPVLCVHRFIHLSTEQYSTQSFRHLTTGVDRELQRAKVCLSCVQAAIKTEIKVVNSCMTQAISKMNDHLQE